LSAEARERLLTGWGRTAPSRASVSRPRSVGHVEALLREAPSRRGVLARGLGRSYGDAAQNGGGAVIDLSGLSGIRAFDSATGRVTVDAGTSLDLLMRFLIPQGWFVAVTPGTRFVTVGGAIACDVHGKNHHREGGFCDHVDSFELVTPISGPMLVTQATTPDVFDASAGGMGLSGVIVGATLALAPIETAWVRVDTERADDVDDLMSRMEAGDHRYRYSVAWIDCLARGDRLGRGILTRGEHATVSELPPAARQNPLKFGPRTLLSAPPFVPPGLVNRLSVTAFNELWFRKAPREERGRIQRIEAFFHPLDGVRNWNRLYGPRGFLQYQFVVPFSAGETVRIALERLAGAAAPSFLAVLKRFGRGRGMLSFPQEGWSLALDVPARTPGLGPLLGALDELVAEAGGRVYLAKDSRLRPELLAAMYPELDRWREVRQRLDPQQRLRSDLDRRLGLAGRPRPSPAVVGRSRQQAAAR
jgi:decaprenylphospho-beta-D-ribofuranose 2-oxidase